MWWYKNQLSIDLYIRTIGLILILIRANWRYGYLWQWSVSLTHRITPKTCATSPSSFGTVFEIQVLSSLVWRLLLMPVLYNTITICNFFHSSPSETRDNIRYILSLIVSFCQQQQQQQVFTEATPSTNKNNHDSNVLLDNLCRLILQEIHQDWFISKNNTSPIDVFPLVYERFYVFNSRCIQINIMIKWFRFQNKRRFRSLWTPINLVLWSQSLLITIQSIPTLGT